MVKSILFISVFGLCLFLSGCSSDAPSSLFRAHSPEQTGIKFENNLVESEDLNIITFEYFYNGAGVGAGDINNDGLPDLFFTANMSQAKLYLNLGNLQFEDITEDAGIKTQGRWTTGIAMADINSDGWIDLYISCAGPYEPERRANLCYLNNRDGTFTESAAKLGIADTGHTTQAAFFDYDRDGDLDLYLLTNITEEVGPNVIRKKKTNGESPNTDRLYRNDGGIFTNISTEAGILKEGYGLGISVTDINQDGWLDVYVSNDYLSNDLLYINQQDGTFKDQAADYFRHTSYSAMGNDVADYNNDARPDIIALDMLPPDNLRRKLMIGSINYDRFRSELITGYTPQYMRNTLQLNQGMTSSGDLAFSEIGQLAGIHSTDWSWSPLLADIDNDGWKDLLITNGYPRDITNMDFSAYKMDQLTKGQYGSDMRATFLKALQSLDGAHLPNFAFRNRGDLTFEEVSTAWGFTEASFSHGAALADLDADGDLDYIVNNTQAPAMVYENTTTHQNYLQLTLQPMSLSIGSKVWIYINGQQQFQELVPYRGYQSSIEPLLHFGLGNNKEADSIRIVWPDGRVQQIGKTAANQRLKITQSEAAQPRLTKKGTKLTKPLLEKVTAPIGLDYQHMEAHYADFKVQPLLPHKHSQQGPKMSMGDLNGDGLEDFFVGGAFKQAGQVFFQQADGRFHHQPLSTQGPHYEEDIGSVFFDADQDGDLDIYVCSGGSEFNVGSPYYQDRLYFNDGKGQFTHAGSALPDLRTSTSAVAAADYDGDGDLDLFVGGRIDPGNYANTPISYLLENQNGYFKDVTAVNAAILQNIGRVTDVHWADFNQDNRPDLLLAGEWMPLTIAWNKASGFELQALPHSIGWWNALCVADLDADGDLDFVGGNLGLNNPYHSTPEKPLSLQIADFDGNNRADAIMTFFLKEREVPVHFRDDLRAWLLPLRKQYPDYKSYAEADWEDVFPNHKAKTTSIETFASAWVENTESGFLLHELPIQAQFAPIHAIATSDANQDGNLDLILAGNDFATETNTGRYDSLNGLLLVKTEAGYQACEIAESGLYLPGDQKSLIILNYAKGGLLMVSGENDGKISAYQFSRSPSEE
ncbi:VCBS repeat-containing protein [Phaeodactylibacter sp.]|uniref:VCBS repeat-containing protein n=2 Tax=Phaeodactylibacter sp. TaxID=1940289 RepID=UPI0025FD84E6|nr:VCBS repeat-containing protein [Phaeodactylibacter sp.]MCI5091058.1 VCBS repeat-containing protein [Phaeodactylibacter sp.]